MIENNNQRALMNSVQRDVMTYVRELEQRIYQLELMAKKAKDNYSTGSFSTLDLSRQQLKEIDEITEFWKSGELDQECLNLETNINSFINTQLPNYVEPFNNQLLEWKNRFNREMSSVSLTYRKLNDSLNIDIKELENVTNEFNNYQKKFLNIKKNINFFTESLNNYNNSFKEFLNSKENDINSSLSSSLQQIKLNLIQSKAISNSTLSHSIETCKKSSLSDLFSTLQDEVNSTISQIEYSLEDVKLSLNQSEEQWNDDLNNLKNEIQLEIESIRRNNGTCYNFLEKIEEAEKKANYIQDLIKNL